ncbi:hypothetical protein BVX98_05070 [bacterium F11]|nr:hypothetical protein BVX98_05070 [bacterium F11]
MPETILTINNLTKTYVRSHLGRSKKTRGIEDVSLEMKKGEVFGLLGLNGSGKTTTIKLMLGLLFPTRGDVKIYDFKVPHPFAQLRIGYLPEVPYFYRNLTSEEVLTLYASLSRMDPKKIRPRIDEVLHLVKMTHAKGKTMREFSKGMLQRIGLAQALIHDPEILILDEPVTGLDPLGIRQIRELMVELNKQGKTIFFSSHSISELERLAHRVGILVEGRLVKLLDQKEWKSKKGHLETLFIDVLESNATQFVT